MAVTGCCRCLARCTQVRTPYVAILLIGVVSLACTIIFTDEQLTKLVNFGAISSFMMLTSR